MEERDSQNRLSNVCDACKHLASSLTYWKQHAAIDNEYIRLSDGIFNTEDHDQPLSCLCQFIRTIGKLTGDVLESVSLKTTMWQDSHTKLGVFSLVNEDGHSERHLPVMFLDDVDESRDTLGPRLLGPRVDFDAVKQWISVCRSHHGDICSPDMTQVFEIPGFKLIECSSRRLVALSKRAGIDTPQFVALSYVWGSQHAADVPTGDELPTQTPKVIDDAIVATQTMGFRYLWVDRYCIPQNNEEAKHSQIKSMDIIYGCASITIIAATGHDPSCGLPGVASTIRNPQESFKIGSGTLVLLHPDIDSQLSKTKWDTRAWTFQEGLLSCRRLCFLENQVYFQCNSMRCMESFHIPQCQHDLLNRFSPLYRFKPSHNPLPFPDGRVGVEAEDLPILIEAYSERELGFQSDALNAFEGVLKRFSSAQPPVYHIWGVPIFTTNDNLLHSLVAGFLWRLRFNDILHKNSIRDEKHGSYSGTMRRRHFPGWSWVEWDGRALLMSGFRIWMQGVYLIVQKNFRSSVILSMESGNGLTVLHGHPDGLPKSDCQDCVKDKSTVVGHGLSEDNLVSKISTMKIHPPVLRLVGYSFDAVLWNFSEFSAGNGKPTYREVERFLKAHRRNFGDPLSENAKDVWVWTDLSRTVPCKLLMGPAGNRLREKTEHDLCTIADGLCDPAGNIPLSPLKKEYHFRVVVLGYMEEEVHFLVLLTHPEGEGHASETYERVNNIQRANKLRDHGGISVPEALEAGLLDGWEMKETRIV
ncbi:heterokaryon incompatibility protein-domain-containing protein [Sordaria brevicollis]|uniref:Heterokaryon incompatibility protein-domain-containing protein n=1 Tax=Sordaria brevicollis TaxID=83679 RepID=A0AAE0PNS6_SORBR|nr:heterokaryon incompatibility protein-domain-containing protein [Sordaria brevicollis]